ncbi:Uncharacterized conserved protein, contains ParB-like and HNH nuclease domains [Algoriphagus alkaliphilus]|uniref:Uncharacterized conserved protein, contains ParB-like and HNH nuclease domains n=1 Tax=Algoriphagus alkaliphilus TaxID=279824 RepID=A0A1G5Z6V1_9BACT|nr:DUF4268 domain-containing protein [Algoriphagus alkaliphilus]MBA4298800.1 DUF4268 domain-containing protein [Cyclobacterium sp.]SDA90326.1 Uncharacterized conserved protein, contains ParB-like and HNH nuclease domains [Algoriphagus alkaliphilus]
MKANELQIVKFLKSPDVQFVIPIYQRNYDWTITECRELLKDIIQVADESRVSHFIGSIVFIHDGVYSTSNEVKELVIIDGQQRLTTINILIAALYRFAKENLPTQESERLYNMFLVNQYVQKEAYKLKLKQTDRNSIAFKAILLGNEKSITEYTNVKENYTFFRSEINADTFQVILEGLNRLIFVEISLERGKDDPQRIFESLNSTGLDLSQSDLIRNFILMDLPPADQDKIFESIWSPIEENAKDLSKRISLVSDFIRDYLTLKTKKIPNKNKVYQEFKMLFQDKDEADFYHELEEIKSFSFHYKKLVNPITVTDKQVRKELEYINRLEINVTYPFLLQVFEDVENGLIETSDLVAILKLIQSFSWRRFIVGLPTNALNKVFMTLYSEIDTEEYVTSIEKALMRKGGNSKFPTNEEVKLALKDKDLYNIQTKNRSYFFELLENYKNKEYVDTSNEAITIEHIFPRTPTEEWKQQLSREQFSEFKDKYLNTIANLTLSGNNGALSNRTFGEKKAMNSDGKEQGYIHSRLWLNSYLQKIDEWTIPHFEERFEIIYERFLKIWKLPDVVVFDGENDEEQNIFDAEKPRFKKLEYFIFDNNKIEEDAVAQMYFYVLRALFQKNYQVMVSGQDILKITRNEADFRDGKELDNGYYFESNIDSNSKFTILKKLLSLFEMEEELIIKYQTGPVNSGEPPRYTIRKKYWLQLLPLLQEINLFQNINASNDQWLSVGAGISGLQYTLTNTKSIARIELGIVTSSKEINKSYFRRLFSKKEMIEEALGQTIEWQELPESKMSRIKIELTDVDFFNENEWAKRNDYFLEMFQKFQAAFDPFVFELK